MHHKEHLRSALGWHRCRRVVVPLVLLSFFLLMAVRRPPTLSIDSTHAVSAPSAPVKQRNIEQHAFQIAILTAVARVAPPTNHDGDLDCAEVVFLATNLAFSSSNRPPPSA
jgi:hypothetical protein